MNTGSGSNPVNEPSSEKALLPILERVLAEPMLLRETGICSSLLEECYSLTDAICLTPLLKHENARVVASAVWIASELGRRSHTLRPLLVQLLRHPDDGVRYWIVIALHSMVRVLSAYDLAQLLKLIATDDWDGIRIRGLEVLVSARSAEYRRPDSAASLDPMDAQSPYVHMAACLQATGEVPVGLAQDLKPPPEAEVLRRKLEVLFQHIDHWTELAPCPDAPFEDVAYVLRSKIRGAERRATARALMASVSTAREKGDQAAADAAIRSIREMMSPEGRQAFLQSLHSSDS